MFDFRWGSAVACAALLVVSAPRAHAQTDRDRAAARSAADAGADAFEQGRYAEALDFFARAEQLFHAPPHLLFMARSAAKLGRLVDAQEDYLKITKETLPARTPAAFRRAQIDAEREIAAVTARIAHVTVTIQGAHSMPPVLLMDGTELSAAVVGIPFPVDPGVHVFKAHAGAAQSADVSLRLADGADESVSLTLSEPKAAPPTPNTLARINPLPIRNAPKEPSQVGGTGQRTWGIVALAAGASAIGLGVYFTASSRSSRKSAETGYLCNPGCTPEQTAAVRRDDSDADRSRNFSIASYVAGGLGVVTGLVLLLTHSAHDASSASNTGLPGVRIAAGPNWIGASAKFW